MRTLLSSLSSALLLSAHTANAYTASPSALAPHGLTEPVLTADGAASPRALKNSKTADLISASQTGLSGGHAHLGPAAWVEADGIHVVLTHKRQQAFAPDAFTGLGLTLDDKRMVVVKSMQHFYAAFAPIASEVRYVAAPGAVPPDYGAIPYTKRSGLYWPRVADPFAEEKAR